MKQYDNYYKDSGIAWLENVPNHWDIVPYKRAVIIKNGKDYKDVQVNEGGFPVIGGQAANLPKRVTIFMMARSF